MNFSIKEWAGEEFDTLKGDLGDFFIYLAEQVQKGANGFLSELMEFVLHTPTLAENEVIITLWSTVRIISFSIIGVMFAYEGFKKVISNDKGVLQHVEFKDMFVRMIYGLIFAVFSLDIIDMMINFNNALIATVKTAFPMTLDAELSVNGVFSFIMITALVIVQIALGIKLILQYWMRMAEIWLMAVLSPLVYTLWINPKWGNYLGNWSSKMITTIFTTFIWALILAIYSGMVSLVSATGILVGFETIGPIAGICLSIAMLLVMIETPSFLRGFMSNSPNMAQSISSTYRNIKNSTPAGLTKKAAGWIINKK